MRIHEGDYAYEIEPVIDPVTRLNAGWRYQIYRVRPVDEVIQSGTAPTKEAAELEGKRSVMAARDADERTIRVERKPAA